jgi:hypothetical protein
VGEEHMFMFRAPGKDFSIGSDLPVSVSSLSSAHHAA